MKLLSVPFFVLIIANLSIITCTGVSGVELDSAFVDYDHRKVPYRIYAPEIIHKLHYDLEEISGLTYFENGLLGAIQDESGTLFLIEAASGNITSKVKFSKSGDYECLEYLKGKMYIMQSDGDLYHFAWTEEDKVSAEKVSTAFTIKNDIEGMTSWNDKLLIITKASGDIKGNKIKGKGGYLYDPVTNKLEKKNVLQLERKKLEAFLAQKNHFSTLKDFDPSGLAIHPISKDIYIISADRAMVVLNPQLEIKEIIKLDPSVYKQPEGICFSPEGTLYIASEGGGNRGRLITLPYIRY